LERDPFPTNWIDKILYLTPEINRCLTQLKELISSSDKLLLITSVPWAGKLTLAEHFESLKDENWMTVRIQVKEKIDINELAHNIIQKLFPDKSFSVDKSVIQVHKFPESCTHNGKILIFIIDDAHKLFLEVLQFLLQLGDLRYSESMFRIVLFADEAINDTLEKQSLKELASDTVHNIHLPSFSIEQD